MSHPVYIKISSTLLCASLIMLFFYACKTLSPGSKGLKHFDLNKQTFLIWNVAYEKGTLEAIGTLANGEKKTFKFQTSGKPAKIQLATDRQLLEANQQDLSYVKAICWLRILYRCHLLMTPLNFEVSGEETLNATGNRNKKSHVSYKENKTNAYSGKCLAIVRSGSKKRNNHSYCQKQKYA